MHDVGPAGRPVGAHQLSVLKQPEKKFKKKKPACQEKKELVLIITVLTLCQPSFPKCLHALSS